MLKVKDGRIVCPSCKKRTHQTITLQTEARQLVLWCEHCKQTHIIDIHVGQCRLVGPCC